MISVIYLKKYANGCIYVGRYRGTADDAEQSWAKYQRRPGGGIAIRYRWYPISCEILEDTAGMTLAEHCEREVYWINHYAEEFGLYPQVQYTKCSHRFISKYRLNGLLLNTHDLDGSHFDAKVRVDALRARFKSFSEEDHDKFHASRLAKRSIYKLPDGFIGDYEQCAEHLEVDKVVFRKWLRGTLGWNPKKLKGLNPEDCELQDEMIRYDR